jgi:hypothetical protein
MTGTWDCQEARIALGVYVLGAIDPAERALVDAHLATCEACQAELAELADLPTLLALVPAADAIALAEGLSGDDLYPPAGFPAGDAFPGGAFSEDVFPDDVFPGEGVFPVDGAFPVGAQFPGDSGPYEAGSLPGPLAPLPPPPLRSVPAPLAQPAPPVAGTPAAGPDKVAQVHDLSAARRRRQRLAWAGIAAAVVLIAAAFFGGARLAAPASSQAGGSSQSGLTAQHPNGKPAGPLVTVHGSNGTATATIAYQPMGWGLQMDALVTGIPVHTRCQMAVVEDNGTRVEVGGWQTDSAEGTVWYPTSTSVPASSIREFVITLATGPQITVMAA